MANRFPLIVDSSAQQIKELPSGDNIDLTGSSLVGATNVAAALVITDRFVYANGVSWSFSDPNALSAGSYANSAYTQANTATTNAATADSKAVTAGNYANSAYTQANTATTNAATADSKAVTAGNYANSAYTQANTATTNALAASTYANAAFTQANTDYTTVSATAGVYGGSSNIPVITLAANGRVSAIVNTSISIPAGTSVYGNTGQITANAATGTVALGLATTAVTPGSYTSSSITVDAYGRITAAANGAGGGGGSVSITNDTTTNANTYYPMLSTATSGSLSTANTANTKLYFNPSTGTLNSTIFNSLSDKNLKTEMVQITGALDKIKQLTGYTYTIIESGERSAGLLSQDVQRVLPEAVRENNGTQSLNYNATIGLLAEGIKELSDKIDEINRKLG